MNYRLFNQSTNSRLRRFTLCSLLFLLTTSIYFIFFRRSLPLLDEPPTYKWLKEWESALPQHNLDLPFPEGRTGRYVIFKNQIEGLGWNNELDEVLMNTWLAYKSKRAYVFQDHIWSLDHYPWRSLKYLVTRPRTPLNALMSGPPAGGFWDSDDNAPRSISEHWFNTVCPKSERRIIYVGDHKPAVFWEPGDVVFKHWEKLLTDAPERCIEVQPSPDGSDQSPQIFDFWLFCSTRILSLWEEFKISPVSRLLAPSAIVKAAVDRNEYLFQPRRWLTYSARDPYERMLAIHLRRGDYKDHCIHLAKWNATFHSWNLLPFLPDKFIHPEGYVPGENTPEGNAHYQKHCNPEHDMILDKIQKSREEYIRAARPGEERVLDTVFLLTNDASSWVEELKTRLMQSGWYTVVTTKDLQLDQEQKDVGLAVDMEFAIKAAVFIGNGWSSFTSGIVHRRLVDGKEPLSIRFL